MKDYYLKVRTKRGLEREISCGEIVDFEIYPKVYDEDFCEFPIKMRLNIIGERPVLSIYTGDPEVRNMSLRGKK